MTQETYNKLIFWKSATGKSAKNHYMLFTLNVKTLG